MKLKLVREAADVTQEIVASHAGVDPAVVSRLERASTPPKSFCSIMRIARALNVDPLDICPVPGLDKVVAIDLPKAVNS